MVAAYDAVEELSAEEAWAFLQRKTLGRLAYHLGDEVHIVPVNYSVVGRRLLFRTRAGSKLLGVILDADVAFETDEVDEAAGRATSVVVRGVASRLDDREIRLLGSAGPRPWVAGAERDEVVAILPTVVTGLSFDHEQDGG